MKANELMIGDWVTVRRLSNRREKVSVKSVIGDGTIEAKTKDGLVVFGELAVEPIPLTGEILEKNGFADGYDCEYDMSYEFAIQHPQGGMSAEVTLKHNEDDAEWVAYLFGPKGEVEELTINHVHELQHALRLCGIEKEIIL